MVATDEPLAQTLAEWATALRWAELDPALQAAVRLRVLDTLGVLLAGSAEPFATPLLDLVREQGGRAESTVAGSGERLPAAWVALAHASLAHGLDFDDTFPASVVHPGSLVVPTALAVGEAVGADGRDLAAAVAAGYEVAARLGAAAGRGLHARGFHASGVIGPVVTALVAGRLYGLPPARTAEAMGLAGSMGGGLLEFLTDGSWSKRLHPGWAAHGGVVAAQLAGRGFPGPRTVLEGRHGLYAAFLGSGTAELAVVRDGLGSSWQSRDVAAKLYPCAHVIHPFLDAALTLRAGHRLAPAAIHRVTCRVARWQVPIVCEPRPAKVAPETEYQARASLPFALAAALIDGRVDLDTFTPAAIRRPELRALAARVDHVEEDGAAPTFSGVVEIHTEEGARLVGEGRQAPPRADRVQAKFHATAGRVLARAAVDELAGAVAALPATTPAALLALCRHAR